MKRKIAATLIAACTIAAVPLSTGFYDALEDAEIVRVYFIKKSPTLQLRFVNIFANDADDLPLERLDEIQRQHVLRYCRYRLGIDTALETQAELERCKRR